jgi:NAD(P)-dependent dehydrogenase (short-subunit alcohol dehydrogenase family)
VFVRQDVTREGDWETAINAAVKLGGLHDLVNNAGIYQPRTLMETDTELFERHMRVNQLGCFLGMKAVAPLMEQSGGGSIVNISSVAGLRGSPGAIAYSATKWALRGMTKAAAIDLAPRRIRVNSVHPVPATAPRGLGPRAVLGLEMPPTAPAVRPDASRCQTPRSPLSSSAPPFDSGPQVFVEPIQRVLPGFFGCGFVVPWGRVVVEAVVGALVDMALMRHMRLSQGGIEGWPPSGDTRVELAVLRIYRRLDFGRIGSTGLRSIEWNRGGKIPTHPHRQLIDNSAAEAEPHGTELAGAVRAFSVGPIWRISWVFGVFLLYLKGRAGGRRPKTSCSPPSAACRECRSRPLFWPTKAQ